MSAMPASLAIGDARLDRVVENEWFAMALTWLFPDGKMADLESERHWLSPRFMKGEELGLSMHTVVLRIDGRVILVDTCVGDHKPRPRHPTWHQRQGGVYLQRLAELGMSPEQVDV